jgi:SAM-dependent methyltransferase
MAETEVWREHGGVRLDRAGEFSVIACERCAFKHVVPIPSEQELRDVYAESYYTEEKPLYLREHEEDLEWWRLCFRERYARFEQELDATRRRVLEIGSGPGTFLEVGRERGWQAVGVEPSRAAAAYARARGLEVVESFFGDALVGSLGRFDVVHLSDVLEHVPDPEAVLRRARRVLEPGGLVAVVVPNDYSAVQRALRDQHGFAPWWVAPPHHINYFDFDSLAALLERCGFAVVERTTTFPIDWFLLMGDDYVGKPAVGRECHARRKRFELRLEAAGLGEVRARLYRALAECGLGREVALLGRLP